MTPPLALSAFGGSAPKEQFPPPSGGGRKASGGVRILVANPFGIGDVLFSLPLVYALRDAYPDGFLGYLCNQRTEELVGALPALNWHIVFEKDLLRQEWRGSLRRGIGQMGELLRAIGRIRFDGMVDLSLGWQYGFAARWLGIPRRVGFNFRGRGRFLTDRMPIDGFHRRPVSEYYLDLLTLLGLSKPETIRFDLPLPEGVGLQVEDYLKGQGISAGDRLIGIVPGGGVSWGPNAVFKQWPPERFSHLADEVARVYQTRILLLGESREGPLCEEVALRMRHPVVQVTDLSSLILLAGILKRCLLVIGNDSGPMHLAASVGTPTVSIFGPVDASVYGPLGARGKVVSKGLACRPCYQGFRFPPCPWGNACLRQLPVSKVMEAVEDLLGGSRS